MSHFHAPENQHNRFLASLTVQERAILRDVERPLPYNTKQQQEMSRPGTAPTCNLRGKPSKGSLHSSKSSQKHQTADPSIEQAMCTTTQFGVPCYSAEGIVAADMVQGRPASGKEEPWRVAHVRAYSVPTSRYGHGEAGSTAFHQKYSWYKFYGFAGKGAKTSWGSNPSKHLNR